MGESGKSYIAGRAESQSTLLVYAAEQELAAAEDCIARFK